jgi:hypothetical protein
VSNGSHILVVDRELRKTPAGSEERFDRLAFAVRALRLLKPTATKVAVYPRRSSICVEQGRDLEHGGQARWATVGIPPDASRENIVLALSELSPSPAPAYLLDALIALGQSDV